jgi:hypothetical protein
MDMGSGHKASDSFDHDGVAISMRCLDTKNKA